MCRWNEMEKNFYVVEMKVIYQQNEKDIKNEKQIYLFWDVLF